jgi:hypothetical protein
MQQRHTLGLLFAMLVGAAALVGWTNPLAAQAAEVDIPYEKFVLDNGLTLIVHEDHKALLSQ